MPDKSAGKRIREEKISHSHHLEPQDNSAKNEHQQKTHLRDLTSLQAKLTNCEMLITSKSKSESLSIRRFDNKRPSWQKRVYSHFNLSYLTWMPILIMFILPSIKLIDHNQISNLSIYDTNIYNDNYHYMSKTIQSLLPSSIGQYLVPLVRISVDRLRFVSIGCQASLYPRKLTDGLIHRMQLISPSSSVSSNNERQDLQEEESHVLVLNPGESTSGTSSRVVTSPYGPPRSSQVSDVIGHAYHGPGPATIEAPTSSVGYAGELPQAAGEYPGPSEGMAMADHGGSSLQSEATIQSGSTRLRTGGPSNGLGSVSVPASGSSSAALQARSDLPGINALNVKCEKNHMTVNIVFDRPFYGLVFSKGHYNDQRCVHLPANSGQQTVNFDIHLGKCGMTSSEASPNGQLPIHSNSARDLQSQVQGGTNNGQQPHGIFIENTIIIQYDPQVQEIYDQARKLRCTWYDYYEKSVSFRPYNVDMLDAVTANFLGDNIQCWMQIQVGKGPWSSEVAGIVKIGQTMTMVLAIKDDENRFDMLVRNCVAHDGKHQPIQLVDEYGCVARPKIMGNFQKVRNFGPQATVVSYAHFQAFKFPDSMSVHFQCVIQVCRFECPPLNCGDYNGATGPPLPPTQVGSSNQVGDYAASGTEMVAAKEHPPDGATRTFLMSPNSLNSSSAMHQIKLDESQGKVQVKLDTSMMTGTRQSNGPLSISSDQTATPISGFHLPRGYAHHPSPSVGQASHRPVYGGHSSSAGMATLIPHSTNSHQQRGSQVAQVSHYSPQFPATPMMAATSLAQRAAYATNRIGELAPDARSILGSADEINRHSLEPEPIGSALSLIATPRALRVNISHDENKHKREKRASGQSTDIRTEKTIQVVSPDDVAFSLLGSDELEPITITDGQQEQQQQQFRHHQAATPTVCFSAVKLLAGVLISLALLIVSIVIAAYLAFDRHKQRVTSSKYRSSSLISKSDLSLFSANGNQTQRDQSQGGCASSSPAYGANMRSVISQFSLFPSNRTRVQEEAHGAVNSKSVNQCFNLVASGASDITNSANEHQRSYLNRFYSQFSPASYWRQ